LSTNALKRAESANIATTLNRRGSWTRVKAIHILKWLLSTYEAAAAPQFKKAKWKSKNSNNQQMCGLLTLKPLATRRTNALISSIKMRKRCVADNLLSFKMPVWWNW
jgi:hypothetical protein